MSYKLVVKDAFWQILGRVISAIGGFFVVKIMTPYLGPLRYGDYSTILKYFAIWSAFADFGIYVIALKKLGIIKNKHGDNSTELNNEYSKFVWSRFFMISIVYTCALIVAYFIPAYTSNPYLVRGLPLGMIFSASFMVAGIVQIPVQLFWKMQQLTIGLILARIVQILALILIVFFAYKNISFDGNAYNILPFNLILLSVILSGVVQGLYVHFAGNKYMKLKFNFDWEFTKNLIKSNRKYGVSYYLSSFHTLIVLMVLGWIFPTIKGFAYVGTWALALTLMELLLIVPSSLGNSIIHKIAHYEIGEKMKSFGNLMLFIFWIGGVFFINFLAFANNIIYFTGGKDYLTNGAGHIGSDTILMFLGVVLIFSFLKQIFNYTFVSTDKQNNLLGINAFGVAIGALIGIPLIFKYNILGGIITQVLLESLFLGGSIYISWKNNVLPIFNKIDLFKLIAIIGIFAIIGKLVFYSKTGNLWEFIGFASILNILILAVSYYPIKKILKQIN